MDCSKLQQDLLNGETTPEIQEHLTDCEECKIFQDSLEQFLTARPDIENYNPPEKLDYEVKKEARMFIEKQMKAYNAESHPRTPLIPRLTSYFAAAACSALVAWLIIIALQPENQDNGNGNLPVDNGNAGSESDISESFIWENTVIDEDLFDVTADIEINHIMLITTFPEEKSEKDEEKESPE